MDHELANGEFWLPPEFLNDEDILTDYSKPGFNNVTSGSYGFGSYGYNSNLGSPVESESDEEDYLNGLTRKLSNTTLHNFENHHSKATRMMAGSPQSTLCGCKNGSSRGSPNCRSPPSTAAEVEVEAEAHRNQVSREILYAAAGELARMRMVEEAASRYFNANNKSYLVSKPSQKVGNIEQLYQQLQIAQFQKLKRQQIAKQQYMQMMLQNRTRSESGNGRLAVPASASSAWLTPQQTQPLQRTSGSGMRAVFLGNPSTKRESTGTGVFLPRQTGAPTEPLKKRGCSTVLLPDRVVQALNLNLETFEAESKLQSRCNDAEIMYRQRLMMAQQGRNNHRQQSNSVSSDFRLPQEWTY